MVRPASAPVAGVVYRTGAGAAGAGDLGDLSKPTVRNGLNNGPQPVGVATAKDAPINVTLNALGTVTPLATATVRPQVGGMLTKSISPKASW